jgi:hypothetical protein
MQSVTHKHFMVSAIILNVVMLIVVPPFIIIGYANVSLTLIFFVNSTESFQGNLLGSFI